MANRLWNLWCELSSEDMDDPKLKLAFNMDRRVARLSAQPAKRAESIAMAIWEQRSAWSLDEFLEVWLNNVTQAERADELQAEELRRARLEAERQQAQAEEEARRRAEAKAKAEEARARAEDQERWRLELARIALVRKRVGHLYNMTPVRNLASIARLGILSHERAARVVHDDASDHGVQARREGRIVAGDRTLHGFASLYFNPRNAMLFRLHRARIPMVVLRVSPDVLDTPGTVITDGNAAAAETRSWLAPAGLLHVDLDRIYSQTWNGDEDLKRTIQAEVLVPRFVPPQFITSVLAPSVELCEEARVAAPRWPVSADPKLFFEQ